MRFLIPFFDCRSLSSATYVCLTHSHFGLFFNSFSTSTCVLKEIRVTFGLFLIHFPWKLNIFLHFSCPTSFLFNCPCDTLFPTEKYFKLLLKQSLMSTVQLHLTHTSSHSFLWQILFHINVCYGGETLESYQSFLIHFPLKLNRFLLIVLARLCFYLYSSR